MNGHDQGEPATAPVVDDHCDEELLDLDGDDVEELPGPDESVEAAMRELFALEVRRRGAEALRATLRRERAEARERARREALAHAERVAAARARLELEHERDAVRDALVVRIDELRGELERERRRRLLAEASALENAALLGEARRRARPATAPRRSPPATARALVFAALAGALLALGATHASAAGALLRPRLSLTPPLDAPSREKPEGPAIALAPPAKPAELAVRAPVGPAQPKPRLASARGRRGRARAAQVAVHPTPLAATPPSTSVAPADDPLDGLGDLTP